MMLRSMFYDNIESITCSLYSMSDTLTLIGIPPCTTKTASYLPLFLLDTKKNQFFIKKKYNTISTFNNKFKEGIFTKGKISERHTISEWI